MLRKICKIKRFTVKKSNPLVCKYFERTVVFLKKHITMYAVKIVSYLQRDENSASAFTLVFKLIVASLLMANNVIITFISKTSSCFPKEPNILSEDFISTTKGYVTHSKV